MADSVSPFPSERNPIPKRIDPKAPPPTLEHCPYCRVTWRTDERAVRFVHLEGHRKASRPEPAPVRRGVGGVPVPDDVAAILRHVEATTSLAWDDHEERWVDRADGS